MKPVLSVRDLRKVYPGKHKEFVAVDSISFDLYPGDLGTARLERSRKNHHHPDAPFHLKAHIGSDRLFWEGFFQAPLRHPKKSRLCQHLCQFAVDAHRRTKFRSIRPPRRYSRQRDPPADGRPARALRHSNKQKHPIAQFSAGQITRLMLVKAFMVDPSIVLLDEPTASLDPDVAQEVCQFVLEQKQQRGTSIYRSPLTICPKLQKCAIASCSSKMEKLSPMTSPKISPDSVSTCRMQLLVGDGMKRTVSIADKLSLAYKMEHRTIEFSLDETQIATFLTALAHAGVVYTNINIIQPTL